MRYHWGLAVGHVYTHNQQCTHAGVLWPTKNHNSQHNSQQSDDDDSEVAPSTRQHCSTPGNEPEIADRDTSSSSGSDSDFVTESDEDASSLWSDEGEFLEFSEMYDGDVTSGYED
jgi:hypothetical protein